MSFERIPDALINPSKPLLWNVYNNSGWLFAREGTTLSQLDLPLGIPKDLYFEAKYSSPTTIAFYQLIHAPSDHISSLNTILHLDSWNEVEIHRQTLFLHLPDTLAQTQLALKILDSELSAFSPSPLWAAKIYRIAQQWTTLCRLQPAQVQLSLSYLNLYSPPSSYHALKALTHAFITIRTTLLAPKNFEEIPTPSTELLTSLTCSCLTYKLPHLAAPLTINALSPQDCAKLALSLLESASVRDATWLFVTREQHVDWLGKYRGISHTFVYNEIVRFCAQVAYSPATLATATATTIINISANSRDAASGIKAIGQALLRALGTPPIGSLFVVNDCLALLLNPQLLVTLTNTSLQPLPQFKELSCDPHHLRTFKPFEPSSDTLTALSDTLLCAFHAYTQKAAYTP